MQGNRLTRLVLLIGVLCSFALMTAGQRAEAAATEKTVRLGFSLEDNFMMEKEGRFLGFSYDYARLVAEYANWNYVYVYGSKEKLLEKFLRGEIDVMPGISYTEARSGQMLFPRLPMNTEEYYIFVPDDERYDGRTLSLSDLTIGVNSSMRINEVLKDWAEKEGLSLQLKYYPSDAERLRAYQDGETDATAAMGMHVNRGSGGQAVARFGVTASYMAVSKNRPDLLRDLDEAQWAIYSYSPHFIADLSDRYFQNSEIWHTVMPDERSWLDSHPVIRVGYMRDMPPFTFEDTKTKELQGVFVELLQDILGYFKLDNQLQYVGYDSYQSMVDDLKDGIIDIGIPVDDDFWRSETHGVLQTTNVMNLQLYMVMRSGAHFTEQTRLGIQKYESGKKIYENDAYPRNPHIICGSLAEQVKALKAHRVDAVLMDYPSYQVWIGTNGDYQAWPLPPDMEKMALSIGLSEQSRPMLRLLNHGITALGDDAVRVSIYRNTEKAREASKTWMDVLRKYALPLTLAALVIVLLFALLIWRNRTMYHRVAAQLELRVNRQKKALIRQNARLETLLQTAENQRQKADEAAVQAEAASRAKSSFLSSMSHDIRTPMNAILGFTHLAQEHPEDVEKVKAYLDHISVSSSYLLELINEILDMSRIESGKYEIRNARGNLTEWLNRLHDVICLDAREHKRNLDFEKSVVHDWVICDWMHLGRVIQNCLSNALKYTEEGGHVRLTIEEQPLEKEGFSRYTFQVADDGIGMSPEFLAKVFEPFSRERTTTVSRIQGTGLGMSIAKSIVDAMGGTMTADSEQGKGTTFRISLDLKTAEGPHVEEKLHEAPDKAETIPIRQPEHAAPPDLSGKHILYAEDNELNREILEAMLEETGVTLYAAENGKEAVDLFEQHPEIDLILMDVQMPVMDGLEAARAIRALPMERAKQVPILAMTANAFEEDRQRAFASGMNDFIAKPMDMPILLQKLRIYLKDGC